MLTLIKSSVGDFTNIGDVIFVVIPAHCLCAYETMHILQTIIRITGSELTTLLVFCHGT